MTYTPSPDDTQPRRPILSPPPPTPPLGGEGRTIAPDPFVDNLRGKAPKTIAPPPEPIDPAAEADARTGRPGCGAFGLVGALLLVFALVIVALAGAAGWTAGGRLAGVSATATQSAAIDEQFASIPDDVTSGNTVLLQARVLFVAENAPGDPRLGAVVATATQLAILMQPTVTPTITPTLAATIAPATATPRAIAPSESESGYDLASILGEAQQAISLSQWQDAIELLDVITAADAAYQPAVVRGLMSQALNAYALELYNAGQPAAANVIVGRAEEFGALQNGLAYERSAAELYLNARAAMGVNYPQALRAINQLLALGQGRYYTEAQTMLVEAQNASIQAYIVQGDIKAAAFDWCGAALDYQNAINAGGSAGAKLSTAQTYCASAAATLDPAIYGTPIAPPPGFAPIGVPGA